jgi:GH43 family beta-xylosidase
VASGPDPWVIYRNGFYYYTNTLGDRIALWRTQDITRLRTAQTRVIWRAPAAGPDSASIWAPAPVFHASAANGVYATGHNASPRQCIVRTQMMMRPPTRSLGANLDGECRPRSGEAQDGPSNAA